MTPKPVIIQTPKGRWTLGAILGRGRRGTVVWQATGTQTQQSVAIKQVPLYGLDEKDRELVLN